MLFFSTKGLGVWGLPRGGEKQHKRCTHTKRHAKSFVKGFVPRLKVEESKGLKVEGGRAKVLSKSPGSRVQGPRSRVQGPGSRVQGHKGPGSRVEGHKGPGSRVQGPGVPRGHKGHKGHKGSQGVTRVQGFRFKVKDYGLRVIWVTGLRVQGLTG